MASNSGTNKRRRTAADTLHITDLPVGFIADVSSYLAKPSRAILAVAFSAPSTSWKNNDLIHRQTSISKAIVSASQWDILDFGNIEEELANKLTDDDISAMLKCINAHDVLKELKLTGCFNIEGYGLHPLRGSSTLDVIDVSIFKHREDPYAPPPDNNSEPLIRVDEVVLPILSIAVGTKGLVCIMQTKTTPAQQEKDAELGIKCSGKSYLFL